ncbi:MAG: hypothetical protein A3G93_05290 [Nitrospinae bacterium RIFCSPLOWO2_12_FULL_45_22]|nr:MAG: hypothetical protein A3G93_05290 [Nitrospinae bacterium RIFCSPLOWO2_12_FULL_45_22]
MLWRLTLFLNLFFTLFIVASPGRGGEPKKERILFASLRGEDVNRDGVVDQSDVELYTVDIYGDNLKRITYNSFQEILVSISPDKKEIAYVGSPPDTVYILNIDGTGQQELLTTNQSMVSKDHYVNVHILSKAIPWSWDSTGVFIPFSYPTPSWYLVKKNHDTIMVGPAEWSNVVKRYEVKIGNENAKRIDGVDSPFILVSPKTDNIISILGAKKEIYLISLKDGRRRRLGTDPFLYESGGSWSPDGKKVCLYRFNKEKGEDDLYLLNLSETGMPKPRLLQKGVIRNQISWSPNGNRIVFISSRNQRLSILNLKDKSTVKIAQKVEGCAYPEWLKNGEGIIFISREKDKHFIYRVNSSGEALKKLLNDSGGILWARPF